MSGLLPIGCRGRPFLCCARLVTRLVITNRVIGSLCKATYSWLLKKRLLRVSVGLSGVGSWHGVTQNSFATLLVSHSHVATHHGG